jgi:hypothetical protein
MHERNISTAVKKLGLGKERKTLPFYLRQGLPDSRFIDFRLFIHNRRSDEVQHDFKYFESMMNPNLHKKKRNCRSEYREHLLYEKKRSRYIKQFTNGSVNLDKGQDDNSFVKVKEKFKGLEENKVRRLTRLIEKALKQKKADKEVYTRPSTSLSPGRRIQNKTSTSFRQVMNSSALK